MSGSPYLVGFPRWMNIAFGRLMRSDSFADRIGWRIVGFIRRRHDRRRA